MDKKLFKELIEGLDQMRKIHKGEIKPRRTWVLNPKTRVVESKKIYKRQSGKRVSEE